MLYILPVAVSISGSIFHPNLNINMLFQHFNMLTDDRRNGSLLTPKQYVREWRSKSTLKYSVISNIRVGLMSAHSGLSSISKVQVSHSNSDHIRLYRLSLDDLRPSPCSGEQHKLKQTQTVNVILRWYSAKNQWILTEAAVRPDNTVLIGRKDWKMNLTRHEKCQGNVSQDIKCTIRTQQEGFLCTLTFQWWLHATHWEKKAEALLLQTSI